MTRTLARVGMILTLAWLVTGCELAAGQLLAMFEFEIVPDELTIASGSSGTLRIVVSPLTGISLSTVSVRLVGAPSGVSADPNPITVFSESDWSLSVGAGVAPGRYEDLQVEAVSQGLNLLPVTRQRTFTLVVAPP